jgi:hypothetical protein
VRRGHVPRDQVQLRLLLTRHMPGATAEEWVPSTQPFQGDRFLRTRAVACRVRPPGPKGTRLRQQSRLKPAGNLQIRGSREGWRDPAARRRLARSKQRAPNDSGILSPRKGWCRRPSGWSLGGLRAHQRVPEEGDRPRGGPLRAGRGALAQRPVISLRSSEVQVKRLPRRFDAERTARYLARTRCLELVPGRTPPKAFPLTWAWALDVGGDGDVAVGAAKIPNRASGGWH